MESEILNAKLCVMDEKLAELAVRIRNSCCLTEKQLTDEITLLQKQITQEENAAYTALLSSRNYISEELKLAIEELKYRYDRVLTLWYEDCNTCHDSEDKLEQTALFAEYGIDFAMISADQAMLLALKTIDAERNTESEE